MKYVALILLAPTLGCASGHRLQFSGLEVGVFGSETNGSSRLQPFGNKWGKSNRERWDNDDVTVGGHATLYFEVVPSVIRVEE